MFKITFITNKLPRVKGADKAFWNRARVLPFESTFCRADNPPPETYEEQIKQKRFPMDKNFIRKVPTMVQAFAWILLQHRKKITVRIEPDKVRAATEIYRKQNDIYRQFAEESITEAKDKYMSLTELYNIFKDWFRDSLPGHTVPVKNEIEEYFTKLWGTPDAGKKWKGYRIRTLQDAVDSGDAIILTEDDLVNYEETKTN
jgi:phage/plasmid-associated DNA primase